MSWPQTCRLPRSRSPSRQSRKAPGTVSRTSGKQPSLLGSPMGVLRKLPHLRVLGETPLLHAACRTCSLSRAWRVLLWFKLWAWS